MRKHVTVFLTAFLIRVASAIVTTLTGLNPESQADAATFASIAARAARELTRGNLIVHNVWLIEPLWGTMLAPYWLLPGPSAFYGRLGNALLGAFAVYNVYVIARWWHSHRAGTIAVLPMIFFPSFVAIHSTLLRESLVLFCITMAARLALVPGVFGVRWKRYAAILPILVLLTILRLENRWLIGAVVIIGVGVYLLTIPRLSIPASYGGLGLIVVGVIWKRSKLVEELLSLAESRHLRAFGRTEYLPTVFPNTIIEILAFSWIGAAYFLFTPFPWMIETPADLLVGLEAIANLLFAVAAIFGVRRLATDFPAGTAALATALVLGSVLYGLGEANVGTAVRHRQQLVWILYLFGGIEVASRFEFVLGQSITANVAADAPVSGDSDGDAPRA